MKEKKSWIRLIIMMVIVTLLLSARVYYVHKDNIDRQELENAIAEIRAEHSTSNETYKDTSWVNDQFSAWDGDCTPVKKELKDNYLKDPGSYDMQSCSYVVLDDSIMVTTKFYANNSYGSKILSTALSIVDKDGKVDIISIN